MTAKVLVGAGRRSRFPVTIPGFTPRVPNQHTSLIITSSRYRGKLYHLSKRVILAWSRFFTVVACAELLHTAHDSSHLPQRFRTRPAFHPRLIDDKSVRLREQTYLSAGNFAARSSTCFPTTGRGILGAFLPLIIYNTSSVEDAAYTL